MIDHRDNRTRRNRANHQRGFSLMELMVVCVLIGIVLVIATPGFTRYRMSLEHRNAYTQLVEDLRAARQMAITQRTPVIVSFGDASTTSNITSYKVHNDKNYDGTVNSGERVLSYNFPSNVKLSKVKLTPTDSLIFDISGLLRAGTSGGSMILRTSQSSNSQRDTIYVSIAGMTYQK